MQVCCLLVLLVLYRCWVANALVYESTDTLCTGDRLVPFEQAPHMFASRYHQKPKDLH